MTPTKTLLGSRGFGNGIAHRSLGKPVAAYPGRLATDADMAIAKDRQQTRLALPMGSSDTSMTVQDPTMIVTYCLLTIDSEIVQVSGPPSGNVVPISRGFDGTTPAVHLASATVSGFVDAYHHNRLVSEIEAIEFALGPNLSKVPGSSSVIAANFDFTPISFGGSLTVGANVLTLAPVPLGVNGTDTDHWLYVSGGTGTAEAVKIIGGSALSGAASGTLIVQCANAHSGAWTLRSATSGASEAVWSLGSAGGQVIFLAGTFPIHAPIKRRTNMSIWVTGQGMQTTTLTVASDFINSAANGVFDWSPGDAAAVPVGGASDLTIQFIQPDSTDVSTYTHWKPAVYVAGTYHSEWKNLTIIAAWDGFIMPSATNGMQAYNIYASHFHRLFDLNGHSFDTVRLEDIHATTVGLTVNQSTAFGASTTANVAFWIGSIDDLKVHNATIGGCTVADLHQGSDGSSPTAYFSNLWGEGNYSQSAGDVRVQGFRTASGASVPMIFHSGGNLTIDGFWGSYTGSNTAIISAPVRDDGLGFAGGTLFSLSNSYLDSTSTLFMIYGSSSAPFTGYHHLKVSNVVLSRSGATAWPNAAVFVDNGTGDVRFSASQLSFSQKSSGSGAAINLQVDNYHSVIGCDGGGWSYLMPGGTSKIAWSDNTNFASNVNYLGSPTRITGKFTPSVFVPLQTENFIASETGANNAIAGALVDATGTNVPLAAGLKFTILLAHTLQAGANTVALNGTVKNIKSSRNPANNIATGYAVGGILTMVYDGVQCLDISQ